MRRLGVLAVCLALASPALAQGNAQSLASIRAELGALATALEGLRAELIGGGGAGLVAAGGVGALARMDAIEAALVRLTAQSEALENRINRVVADGTNRLGDLEFRLCELEPGCDISKVGATPLLGGGAVAANGGGAIGAGVTGAAPALAMSEQADFDRAKAALDAGEYARAAELFAVFNTTYTGGPLTADAQFYRGQALQAAGDVAGAARAWLEGFAGAPDGPRAPESLLMLGRALADLQQVPEACAMLTEVGLRFPGAAAATEAGAMMRTLNCQ
ncbi:tol-pal system protein YbgF [Phaeovulum sp.]|jgi:tol-pal system protein YbgF|uniref:tol-pal system protein YbgF n=1 Tax=Phaeovulum sp. TaxID=2934796 RepID=UPI00273005EA|nr:tol-pal system protein YbgF [Phaeovulum sp.]MDP1667488.1 tol-pal system protein YbgF [Phaeovulum sp.]MDZ4120005.1 tol-pal system protein YbgF [Phaeovulum sp.]